MTDSFDLTKMASSVDDGILTIARRTYRSGDFVHVILGFFAAVFAILFFVIAIANGTLFDRLLFPITVLLLGAYAYFAVTRLVNRRTVTVANGRVMARDGPLPQFVRSLDAELGEYGKVEVRSAMRFAFPPISKYRLYSVGGDSAPDLFRRLPTEDEAKYAVARIRAFTPGSD